MRIDGALHADGLDGSLLVSGDGSVVTVTVTGTAPTPSRVQIAALARFARGRRFIIEIIDHRGRPLAELGADTSSILGRALVGTSAVRLRFRALRILGRGSWRPRNPLKRNGGKQ